MEYREFIDFIEKHEKAERIPDGIYDTTGIDFIVAKQENSDDVIKWSKNKDKFWLASAYQTEYYILYETEPPKFTGNHFGHGFNYGSTNMLTECPESILILAEDD